MIVGCYSVHLYCDHDDAGQHKCSDYPLEVTGETLNECLDKARAQGWAVDKRYKPVRCPKHRDEVAA